MEICIDSLEDGAVIKLLQEHLADMYATSPPESVHALDIAGLKAPEITFFSSWRDGKLLGCLAIKQLSSEHAELKSMRTTTIARNQGVASTLLQHVVDVAKGRGYKRLSLETGSMDYFKPARSLYEKYGFSYCEPFADYQPDPYSKFMKLML
jgi:putative acetyltransferase